MTDRPYVHLFRALDTGGVGYAVAGGLAVVLHGVPRLTFDLDVLVDLAPENLERLVAVLGAEGYRPRLPVPLAALADPLERSRWAAERNLVAFTVTHPGRPIEEVDVLLVSPFAWAEVAASLDWRSIEGARVPVLGRALLRRMKLATGREKDAADAALLGSSDE